MCLFYRQICALAFVFNFVPNRNIQCICAFTHTIRLHPQQRTLLYKEYYQTENHTFVIKSYTYVTQTVVWDQQHIRNTTMG